MKRGPACVQQKPTTPGGPHSSFPGQYALFGQWSGIVISHYIFLTTHPNKGLLKFLSMLKLNSSTNLNLLERVSKETHNLKRVREPFYRDYFLYSLYESYTYIHCFSFTLSLGMDQEKNIECWWTVECQ